MKIKETTDAVEILQRHISQDPELVTLVEEERQRLNLADKVRSARQASGLSQQELAQMIGSTQSTIAGLESGDYERLSISTLLKVSLSLNCHLRFELEAVDD